MASALADRGLQHSYTERARPGSKIVPFSGYQTPYAHPPGPSAEDYAASTDQKFDEVKSMFEALLSLLAQDPSRAATSQEVVPTAEQKFAALAERWNNQTRYCSSVLEMAMHPSYQQIIGMGRTALPFILKELRQKPDHWFWALRAISGEDPVPPTAKGDILKMTQAWLLWGARQGYEF